MTDFVLQNPPSAQSNVKVPRINLSFDSLDPRSCILFVMSFAIVIVACFSLAAAGLGLIVSALFFTASKAPKIKSLKTLLVMDSFMLFMFVSLPFTMPGEALVTIFGLPLSMEGFEKAALIAMKANAIMLMSLALLSTLKVTTFTQALHALHMPASLIHLLQFTIRYIDVLKQEYQTMRFAMRARGFTPHTSLHTYRSFGYLIGMMLVRSMERSERIMDAMKCRGFTGAFPVLRQFQYHKIDILFASLAIALFVMIILLELRNGAY